MDSIEGMRKELAGVFQKLKKGQLDPKEASQMNNCAGKILNSLRVELEYYAQRKEQPVIKFFDGKKAK